ncbi:MAG: KPN_02809 family neutral zinc metallopeptidase [Planctomycetia bacterium]
MRLDGGRESENVSDQRGGQRTGGPMMIGGGLGTLVLMAIVFFLGGDPIKVLQFMNQVAPPRAAQAPVGRAPAGQDPNDRPPANDQASRFVRQVLASTEDVWREQFAQMKRQYRDPTLVLFTNATQSACGFADSAVGPFYCPADQRVYIDLGFFRELDEKYQAPGDFAQAYVIAHEIGHHVQRLLGVTAKVDAARVTMSKKDFNALSVRLELQADFFAGVWAHHANKKRRILEPGDLEEGLRAASAIGDDRLQKQSRGYVVPDSFTHGTSEQRVRWFRKGFETGDVHQADTFKAKEL